MNINNKYVIITGGVGFIGLHFANLLIKEKYKVIILDNNKPKSFFEKKIIRKAFLFIHIDITNEEELLKLYKKFKLKKIFVSCIINNAAIDAVPMAKVYKSHLPDLTIWNKELSVSLTGSYLMIKYFGEQMASKKGGKIINIGSDLSVIAPNQDLYKDIKNFLKPVTYSVIKHGMLGMTKYFASLYAKKNVQVNMLSPGPIFNNQKKIFVKRLINFIPMKRMGFREDLDKALLFLIDKKNNYITGQNIVIDGGRTII